MQGLTIAIFRRKLNFFFGKIFVYLVGVLKMLGFLVSDFLVFSDFFLLALINVRMMPNNSVVILNVPTYCLVR